jgi:hypothetical protein
MFAMRAAVENRCSNGFECSINDTGKSFFATDCADDTDKNKSSKCFIHVIRAIRG